MFQLLQPIWMFATTGIIIPVIIHFWNRKQGKTLKVGSISLLTQSYKQQAKSIHLQELLLLLLRSMLILLIALLLSRPVFEQQPDSENRQGWILMEKQGLQQTYVRFKPVIDSLTSQRYEFHYFDAGFAKDNLAAVLKNNSDSLVHNNFSYWSLLSSLDEQVPTGLPVYLFTANSLKRFTGNRPKVAMNLQWYTYTSKDSVSEWLAKAYITTADSIRLVAATSQPSGTAYFYKNAPVTSQKTEGYDIRADTKKMSVSYRNDPNVSVDTTTLKITVFTDKFSNDAAYLKAAFEAIRQYSKRKIKLLVVNNIAAIPSQQDWVFWLSDQPLKDVQGSHVFVYEKGKAEVVGSSIQTAYTGNDETPVSLYKRIAYQPATAGPLRPLWLDGYGNPLLELENSKVPLYHFFSRFDPSWNDLPWSSTFPQMIFNLTLNTQSNIAVSSSDNRIMDQQQLKPVFAAAGNAPAKEKLVKTLELSEIFWLAAFLVLFIERYLSSRTKMQKTNA